MLANKLSGILLTTRNTRDDFQRRARLDFQTTDSGLGGGRREVTEMLYTHSMCAHTATRTAGISRLD